MDTDKDDEDDDDNSDVVVIAVLGTFFLKNRQAKTEGHQDIMKKKVLWKTND